MELCSHVCTHHNQIERNQHIQRPAYGDKIGAACPFCFRRFENLESEYCGLDSEHTTAWTPSQSVPSHVWDAVFICQRLFPRWYHSIGRTLVVTTHRHYEALYGHSGVASGINRGTTQFFSQDGQCHNIGHRYTYRPTFF